MQEADLFVTLAEIAGVFVGFGVVVAALAPVVLGAYDIGEREVWLVCSLVALAGFVGVWAGNLRTPEAQQDLAAMSRAEVLQGMAFFGLLWVPMLVALVLVVLGLFTDQEPAFYLTTVVLGLFLAASTLVALVFTHRRPAAASDEAEQPAE